MSSDQWELAALNKEKFTVYYGDEANIQTARANAQLADGNSKRSGETE
jgi:hypothetical protein